MFLTNNSITTTTISRLVNIVHCIVYQKLLNPDIIHEGSIDFEIKNKKRDK
jgi:hypothetical protein